MIDIFDKSTGEVTSIKSKTPNAAYWTKEGGLRDSIKTDLNALAKFVEDGNDVKGTWEKGTPQAGAELVVEAGKVTSKTLMVAVKRGSLSERHYAEIRQAQEYADGLIKNGTSTRPIKVVVVEVD